MSADDLGAFDGPATLIFSRKVKPGREAAYRRWVSGFQDATRQVPGFLGASTMGHGAVEGEYISIVRFDTFEHLREWEASDLRRDWLGKLPPDTVDGEADLRRLEGLEFWFTQPGKATAVAPSTHKMALVLLVIVFALVNVLTPVTRAALADAPQLARSFVVVACQVGLMTYVIMPRVTRLLSKWLFRAPTSPEKLPRGSQAKSNSVRS
jgi:antibiotic biosynthesis monooxygenase (ABM) superfamily enzyme